MNGTTIIRTDDDLYRLLQSVLDDFLRLRWAQWMRNAQQSMEDSHARYFDSRSGPDGLRWAPNAPSTIKRKGHGRQLEHKLELRPSLTMEQATYAIRIPVDEWPSAKLIFGTDHPWSAVNHYGNQRIPARPHVGLTVQDFDRLAESAVDHALQGLVS